MTRPLKPLFGRSPSEELFIRHERSRRIIRLAEAGDSVSEIARRVGVDEAEVEKVLGWIRK